MDVTRHVPHSKLRQLIDKASVALARRRARPDSVSRRNFLHVGALAGAGVSWSGAMAPAQTSQPDNSQGSDHAPDTFNEATIRAIAGGDGRRRTSAVELTASTSDAFGRSTRRGPRLNSVLELNPDALAMARTADRCAGRAASSGRCTASRSC